MNRVESKSGIESEIKPNQQIAEEEIPMDKKVEENISGEVGDDLEKLFTVIKRKFNDPDAGWTPAKLEEASTELLRPIIMKLRDKLKQGGSAVPDVILQAVIDEAISHAQSDGTKEDFIDKMTNPAKVVTGSNIAKFNIFIANSQEK